MTDLGGLDIPNFIHFEKKLKKKYYKLNVYTKNMYDLVSNQSSFLFFIILITNLPKLLLEFRFKSNDPNQKFDLGFEKQAKQQTTHTT